MLCSWSPMLSMAAPVTQLARLAAQPFWSSLAAFERPMEPHSTAQPTAGPGPSSQRWSVASLNSPLICEQRRFCRWLGETRCQAVTAVDLGTPQTNTAVAIMESKVHSDADVRMDAQVTFEACWRRFEEKFRLKVCYPGEPTLNPQENELLRFRLRFRLRCKLLLSLYCSRLMFHVKWSG